jgi:sortase A
MKSKHVATDQSARPEERRKARLEGWPHKRWSRLFAFALLLIGTVLVLRALYIPAKGALAQVLLERAFARAKPGEAAPKPWPWADMVPIARLEIPRLNRSSIVIEGASGQAMAFGPGHMPNTPAIGTPGTAVIAAHRDTQFAFLGALRPGDLITVVTAGGRHLRFRVSETRIVRADTSDLDPADGGASGTRLALVTCYPFTGVLHSPLRYVVLADQAPSRKVELNRPAMERFP